MPFACIFVPDFPVEAILRAEPELRSQAVAVLEGKPPLQKLFALNDKARSVGLELAMTKLQVEAWPDLVLRNRSVLQETAAHAALLDCAQSFSPRIEDTACDTVVLDICGMEALFGPPAKLARDLARRASELGIEANVAVASNPDAATIAARGYPGVTVIPPGEEEDRLGSLPLPVLFGRPTDDSAEFLETLERWGIRNLRGFATLPELAISERLGEKGVHRQRLARGAVYRTIVPVDPPLAFEEAIELEYPVVLLEPLAFLLTRLLDQVCARLSSRALATQELRLKLQLETGLQAEDETGPTRTGEDSRRSTIFKRVLRLPLPMLDPKIFLKLLQLDLKAHPPGAPISKIWLAAEPARMRAAQGGLFQPPSPEPEKLELTLARIAGIVGENKVGCVEVLDTHRPDAFRMQHFSVVPQRLKPTKKTRPDAQTDTLRELRASSPVTASEVRIQPQSDARIKPTTQAVGPELDSIKPRSGDRLLSPESQAYPDDIVTALRMFRPPLGVAVTLRDGHPARIVCPKRKEVEGEVIWHAGPWRSSGDWWEQEPWARDEWDIAVQTTSGLALYRLVRDLLRGKWFVEGTYD
jgi:protein ImuB